MTPAEAARLIAARPEPTLVEAAAAAAYAALLDAQRRGVPGSVRARMLVTFADVRDVLAATADALAEGLPP